jgi:hypothetical protein
MQSDSDDTHKQNGTPDGKPSVSALKIVPRDENAVNLMDEVFNLGEEGNVSIFFQIKKLIDVVNIKIILFFQMNRFDQPIDSAKSNDQSVMVEEDKTDSLPRYSTSVPMMIFLGALLFVVMVYLIINFLRRKKN